MMSLSFMMSRSSPSTLTSEPDHLPNKILSPTLRSIGTSLPASSQAPGPTATILPSCGFSLALSGMMMAPLVFSSPSRRLTTTRSCRGRNVILVSSLFWAGDCPGGSSLGKPTSKKLAGTVGMENCAETMMRGFSDRQSVLVPSPYAYQKALSLVPAGMSQCWPAARGVNGLDQTTIQDISG